MKRIALIVSFILIMFALVPAAAMAEGSYLGMKLGQFNPNDDDFDGYDTTMNLEFVFGKRISNHTAFEVGLLYRAPEAELGNFESTSTTIGIPFTFKGILPVGNNFDLFAGIGLGLYYSKVEGDMYVPGYGTASTDVNGFGTGVHVVGGADFKVTPALALGAELKWEICPHSFDDPYMDGSYDLGGVTMGGVVKYLF